MPKLIHVVNAANRDARVALHTLRAPPGPRLGLPGRAVRFRRFVAAGEHGLDDVLARSLGPDYGQQLVDGDPEIDTEIVGREVARTETVYLSSEGEVLHASPQIVEVLLDTFGDERERRAPEDVPANVNDALPVRWTGRRLAKRDAVRQFAFRRTLQIRHVDGLTYDYLFAMTRELAESGELVLVGAGPRGRDPLVFQENGLPSRGFLEGRVDGERYMLLLHLSDLELKRPKERTADAGNAEPAEGP
ncbi:MAG: hypothetical protein H6700_09760 [Myxococcales bacterium]|nr:hypothetical protein [Myxococcales bacterium]MCB9532039.1 hypothetical protein [Myxococcales bacterium]